MRMDPVIGILAALFLLAWVVYLFFDARRTNRCYEAFNKEPRFCRCGGRRVFDDVEYGMCTDHCDRCRTRSCTPMHVFIIGHQCSEASIEANGRCADCGRMHRPRTARMPVGMETRTA